jgi:hypothetical protein
MISPRAHMPHVHKGIGDSIRASGIVVAEPKTVR